MGKLFIPMYTSMPCQHRTRRPQRTQTRCPASMYQPSLLDVLLTGVLRQLQTESTNKQTRERRILHPWIHRVDLEGFQPEHMSVKVEDHTVHITAKHVRETDNGHDVMERYRKVNMPEDVDVDKLSCFLDESGNLIMKAPFVAHCPTDTVCSKSQNGDCCRKSSETKQDEEKGNQTHKTIDDQETTEIPIQHEDAERKHSKEPETVKESLPDESQVPNVADDNQECDPTISEVESDVRVKTKQKKLEDSETVINTDELTGERNFDILEDHVYLPNTPQESIEFVIFDKTGEETIPNTNRQTDNQTNTENIEPDSTDFITHQKNTGDSFDGNSRTEEEQTAQSKDKSIVIQNVDNVPNSPVTDMTTVRDIDGQKQYEITVHLEHYKPEHTSIRLKDDTLQINAEKEAEIGSMKAFQKVHKEYKLPEQGLVDKAEAMMNDAGILRVTVPLNTDN